MTVHDTNDLLLHDAARFAAHPDFEAAVRTYCVGLARFRQAPRLINAIVSTDVRWRIVGFLFYLQADRERFGPEGGATYGRLLELCQQRDEASPRAVKAMLSLLRLSGLVRVVPSQADRRVKFYHSTPKMDLFFEDWLRYATATLDILEPGARRLDRVGDRAFREHFSVSGGRAHLEDPVPLADRVPPPMSALKSMLGSYSVINAVMLAALTRAEPPSRYGMAKRYGLSRSQVNAVVVAGRSEGLFVLDGDGGVRPTPALDHSVRRWIAIELAFYARHMPPSGPGRPADPDGRPDPAVTPL